VVLTSTPGQPTCELGFLSKFRGVIAISHTTQNVGVRDLRAELEWSSLPSTSDKMPLIIIALPERSLTGQQTILRPEPRQDRTSRLVDIQLSCLSRHDAFDCPTTFTVIIERADACH
jgi:hypothetical protein